MTTPPKCDRCNDTGWLDCTEHPETCHQEFHGEETP